MGPVLLSPAPSPPEWGGQVASSGCDKFTSTSMCVCVLQLHCVKGPALDVFQHCLLQHMALFGNILFSGTKLLSGFEDRCVEWETKRLPDCVW